MSMKMQRGLFFKKNTRCNHGLFSFNKYLIPRNLKTFPYDSLPSKMLFNKIGS